jgi:hypothetical protein
LYKAQSYFIFVQNKDQIQVSFIEKTFVQLQLQLIADGYEHSLFLVCCSFGFIAAPNLENNQKKQETELIKLAA